MQLANEGPIWMTYAQLVETPYGALGHVMSYCQIWCLRVFGHAATWPFGVVSIPSLNATPVMTLAR